MTRAKAALAALLLSFLAALAVVPARADPQFPKLTGRVVDAANVIPDDEKARLTQKLADLEQQSHRQLVVATIPDLQGYDIADYGYQLGRAWGIGDKQRNDGAILIVAPNERKLRIEVGYGLEPVLTDGLSWLVIDKTIVPKFKAGDLPGGIEAGTDKLVQILELPPDEAARLSAQASAQRQDEADNADPGAVIFFIVFLFFFVIPLLRSLFGGRRRRRGWGGPFVWMPPSGGWGGGGGGWGGGGGGFSGGGGSFGGGGASGGW